MKIAGNERKEFGEMNERALIQAAQNGDLEAFNQLVLAYQQLVYNQANWLLGDPETASDITQDSLIKAYHSLPSFRGESLRQGHSAQGVRR